ncbi:MAG: asparagine--tRNA ligase [Patescibacteria group bacterium]
MPDTLIKDLKKYLGESITVKGWIYNFRSSGKLNFLQIRDGSGQTQVIAQKELVPDNLKIETSCIIIGQVSKHPKLELYELQAEKIEIIQIPLDEYPISKKEHGPDFLMDHRHLWLRSQKQWATLRIRHMVKVGFQDYFNSNGFIELDTPTFTPNSCEGTTDLFEVNYFDQKAYLTQNGQLYLEAMCMSFGKVYDLCPNFRAEKSKTRKHLTEFWTLNPEMAFCEHEESLKIQEASIKHMLQYVLDHGLIELQILERDIEQLKNTIKEPFQHYEYPDAIKELQSRGSQIQYGDDLGAEDEELLTKDSDTAVIIKNWPKAIKPFYMKVHAEDESRVLNADILAPRGFGEIVGGSQREDDYETLLASLKKHNLNLEDFGWYLDLRKYGSVPHCGFGIGIERMTRWVSGIHHIRECIPFPRMLNRLKP